MAFFRFIIWFAILGIVAGAFILLNDVFITGERGIFDGLKAIGMIVVAIILIVILNSGPEKTLGSLSPSSPQQRDYKREAPRPGTVKETLDDRKALKSLAQTIHIERLWRDQSGKWDEATSWFGGLPRLGEQAWPRSEGSEIPMQFVAQLDMNDIRTKAKAEHLPLTGSLAFFLSHEEFGCKVMYIENGRNDPPLPPPADKPSPFAVLSSNLHFADEEVQSERQTYPEWPVALLAITAPDLAFEVDGETEEMQTRSLREEAVSQEGMMPLVEENWFNAPYPFSDFYWHSAFVLLDLLRGEICQTEVSKLHDGTNIGLSDHPTKSQNIAEEFDAFVANLEAQLSGKEYWEVMKSDDLAWFQDQCEILFKDFKITMRNHYIVSDFKGILQISLSRPLAETYWHTAKLALCAMSLPQVEENLAQARNETLYGLEKDIDGSTLANAFVQLRDTTKSWVEPHNPWTVMSAKDVTHLKELFVLLGKDYEEIVRYVFCLNNFETLQRLSLNAMICDTGSPIAELPLPAQKMINLSFRQSITSNHQMFGQGIDIQGNAAYEYHDWLLLLQLYYDEAMGWQFGDVGVYQFWIRPEDFKSKRWDRIEVSFEAH